MVQTSQSDFVTIKCTDQLVEYCRCLRDSTWNYDVINSLFHLP